MLSDEERRRLEKLERELAASDPDLNLELQSGQLPGMSARTGYGIMAALAGFTVVIIGIITQLTIIGVIGFLLMGAGAHLFLSGFRPPTGTGASIDNPHKGDTTPSGT